jgi:uncharacterized protein
MQSKIEQWKLKKSKVYENHKKLINKLKKVNDKKLNQLADEIHEQIFEQIDCLECANCCKSIPPIINETDIRRIAKYLGQKVTDFKDKYVKYDDDMDMVMNCSPCHFLQTDNKCDIYEYRPKACREYPHTGNFEFSKNLRLHAINSKYCPAVFHILEEIGKKML